MDVSAVTYPAYDKGTSVGARAADYIAANRATAEASLDAVLRSRAKTITAQLDADIQKRALAAKIQVFQCCATYRLENKYTRQLCDEYDPDGEFFAHGISEAAAATPGFDALVRCQGITEFTCRLVERKEWPKSYGSYPVHLVQRAVAKPSVSGLQ